MSSREEEIESAMPADLDALPRLEGFRLRGMQMTRLETFIDAAFAFAITMLVIAAQEIPNDIETLLAAFRNVPTFIFSIFVIGIFWRGHWLWSRRYGLEDGVSIFISWSMLVTILIYIYPLKAVFGSMFYYLTHGQYRPDPRAEHGVAGANTFCDLRDRFHRDRGRDLAPKLSGLALARAAAPERA